MPWSLLLIDVISFIAWRFGKTLKMFFSDIPLIGKPIAAIFGLMSFVGRLVFFIITIILIVSIIRKIVKVIKLRKKLKEAASPVVQVDTSNVDVEESVQSAQPTAQTSGMKVNVAKAAKLLSEIKSFK